METFIWKYVVISSQYMNNSLNKIISESKLYFTDDRDQKYNKSTMRMVWDPYWKKYTVVDEEERIKIEKQNTVNNECKDIRGFICLEIRNVRKLSILRQIKILIQDNLDLWK